MDKKGYLKPTANEVLLSYALSIVSVMGLVVFAQSALGLEGDDAWYFAMPFALVVGFLSRRIVQSITRG